MSGQNDAGLPDIWAVAGRRSFCYSWTMKICSCFWLFIVSWILVTTTHAVAATPFLVNTNSGAVLLSDSFENQTTGAQPATANMNPGAPGSSWFVDTSGGGTIQTVTNLAFMSLKSIQVYRPTTFTALWGDIPVQNSGTLNLKVALYVPSPGGLFLPSLILGKPSSFHDVSTLQSVVSLTPAHNPDNGGTAIDSIRLYAGTGFDGTYYYSSSLFSAFQTDKWMELEIIHTIGTKSVTARIGNVTDSYTNTTGTATSSFNEMIFAGSPNGSKTFYLDAIPEPSAALLIGLGGLVLSRARRRIRQ